MGEDAEGRRFARFFDLSVDLLCVVGFDGYFKRLNPAWERALGVPLDELRARHWTELIWPDDRDATIAQGRQAPNQGTMFFENRYRCAGGGYRWLQWSVIRVPEEEVFYAVARDVTEQKQREAQLRASEAYKTAILASADAIVTIDTEGRVVEFNPAAERMFGYRAEQVTGKRFAEFAVPPDGRGEFYGLLARILDSAAPQPPPARGERTAMRADGSSFPLEMTVTRVDAGRPLLAAFLRDLTEAKRIESERRGLEAQLRQAQKMEAVGRLAGGVAHDFNNLLSVILGFTDFAAAALPADAPAAANLVEVKSAAQRAVVLVRQLLAFSRHQVLSPKLLDANGVILGMERVLRGLAGEQIELELALDPHLPRVKADPGQLEQVLVNLAVNARDAMPDGGRLRIETTNAELGAARIPAGFDARPGPYVCICVEDTGVGMTDEVASRAFEPFFTTKEIGKATGLGLSTVYGIVTQSGGFVRFQSAPGKGTIFHVYLPRAADEAAAVERPAASSHAGKTVLLVEDEEAVRHLVRKILEQRGYKVLLARHGGEALEICRRADLTIHLLLTDAVMPVLSGPELLRRAIALRPDMRLAIMSGYTDRPTVTGVPFIAKPFTPDELDQRIRDILDGRPASEGPPRLRTPRPPSP